MQTDKQKNRQTGNQTNRQKTSRYGQTDQKKKQFLVIIIYVQIITF